MTDTHDSSTAERRRNPLLRMLINEMLEQVRELNQHATAWTPDERAKAEAQLERIMDQVRGAASRQSTS